MTKKLEPLEERIPPELKQYVYLHNALGKTIMEICDKTKLSYNTVRSLVQTDDCKMLKKAIQEAYVQTQYEVFKMETSRLWRKCLKVIDAKLEQNDLNAVSLAIKVMAGDGSKPDDGKTQNNQIVVNMPGAVERKPRKVKSEVNKDVIDVEDYIDDKEDKTSG